jgi:exonuclease III
MSTTHDLHLAEHKLDLTNRASPRANTHFKTINTTKNNKKSIKIGTFNIMSSANSRLALAMKAMRLMNVDIGVLTETKLTDDFHPMKSNGYDIITTQATSRHQGGVALFFDNTSDVFVVKGALAFSPNVIWAKLISGNKKWTILGCYIPPSEINNNTLNFIQLALQHDDDDNDEYILLGDLNVNLNNMHDLKRQQDDTAALLLSLGLHDLQDHFRL